MLFVTSTAVNREGSGEPEEKTSIGTTKYTKTHEKGQEHFLLLLPER